MISRTEYDAIRTCLEEAATDFTDHRLGAMNAADVGSGDYHLNGAYHAKNMKTMYDMMANKAAAANDYTTAVKYKKMALGFSDLQDHHWNQYKALGAVAG